MNYSRILPRLFVGSHPENVEDIDRLRREAGVTAVLNLQTDEDMQSVNLAWEPLEAHYRACGVEFCRVPVRDFDLEDLRQKLPDCVRALDELLMAGYTVYLHCTAGTGRSSSVAIAYLHSCRGWDLDAAAEYIRQRRECSPNVEAIRLTERDPVGEERSPRAASPEHTS